MTFAQLKTNIRNSLNDNGITFYSADDINDSVDDSYQEIAALTQCIIKKTIVSFQTTPYYDFKVLGINDFLAVTAIFNNNNNRWLRDNITYRDLDLLRSNWETWVCTPSFWLPASYKYTIIVPNYSNISGLQPFDLYYWATAPAVVDANTPLIANDMQKLIEWYGIADLIEQAEEFTKASIYWQQFFEGIEEYSQRVKNLAKSDLIRIG